MADLGFAFGLEPEAAVKYFEGLGYNVPSDWNRTWNEAQAKARAIAGIHKQDIIGEFHGAMYEAMKSGKSYEAWRDEVQGRLKAHDWHLLSDGDIVEGATGEVVGRGMTKHRMETIFRTQMQSAYAAGHWQSFEEGRDFAPWLQYSAVLDRRTRQSHAAAHGAVYHIDDPFWDYFYPPNGFNCRCTVRAFSDGDLKRRGLQARKSELEDIEVVVNKKGETRPAKAVRLPDGTRFYTDAGFQGNVGKSHLANLGQLQMQRAAELPPKLAAVSVREALKQPDLLHSVSKQAAEMVRRVNTEKVSRGQVLYVGALAPQILESLAARNVRPKSAVIAMSDERVLHGLRDKKVKPLPVEFWERIPELLQEPEQVLLGKAGRSDDAKQYLAFIYPLPDGTGKLVVTLDYDVKSRHPVTGKKEHLILNMVNTGAVFDKAQETALKGYDLIWKKP